MTENLSALFIQVFDQLAAIKDLQQLLDMAMEQDCVEDLNKQCLRVDLLVRAYQARIDYHFSELDPIMEQIREHFRRLQRS